MPRAVAASKEAIVADLFDWDAEDDKGDGDGEDNEDGGADIDGGGKAKVGDVRAIADEAERIIMELQDGLNVETASVISIDRVTAYIAGYCAERECSLGCLSATKANALRVDLLRSVMYLWRSSKNAFPRVKGGQSLAHRPSCTA